MGIQEVSDGLSLTVNGGTTAPMKLFLVMTFLSFIPALVISVTSFTRIVIVLSFLRQALGTPQLPPNPVLIGISLFLSLFVMSPTLTPIYDNAVEPFLDDKIDYKQAAVLAKKPLIEFMVGQTREKDLQLFFQLSGDDRPQRGEELPFSVVVPAFMISELTTAFTMGLYIFLPLVLVDLLVSAVLMALGMMMVPPTMISLPIKIGIFLLADGWHLVVGALARSF
ncbi:MAG: flagellar type III secretion system pore protein FliP [Deltaproteobacteria bacterium]|nr:flagellar type III secretion system pore protein FliP [Deltaproteobacteria bacterium]